MLLSIVFIISIVFAIVFIIMKACDSSDILKIIIAIFSIASVITFFIMASKSVSYTGNIKMSEKIESTQKIVNLKDNRDTKGHFLLEQVMWAQKHTTIITTKLNPAVIKLTKLKLINVK